MVFQVGDRVRTVYAGGEVTEDMLGWEGEVIRVRDDCIGVRFDEKYKAWLLHDCGISSPENINRCWWCCPNEIDRIEDLEPSYSEDDWEGLLDEEASV